MREKFALTIPETANFANVGKDLIYAAIKKGELRSLKIGRKRLILTESLQSWLVQKEKDTAAELAPERSRDA